MRVFRGFFYLTAKHKENMTFSCHYPSNDNATLAPRLP